MKKSPRWSVLLTTADFGDWPWSQGSLLSAAASGCIEEVESQYGYWREITSAESTVLRRQDLGDGDGRSTVSRAAQPDRTLKFVRSAFVWLLASAAMLPFFLPYGFWSRQGFAHDYMAAYHHAYTVGFVSMMIVGVASRVVPILAGLDASRLSRLWGPFLLLNIGCLGRVSLQITADWFPQVAFPLVGLTGFLEVAALSWWGIELWRLMNIAANRPKLLVTSVQPARPRLISIAN